MSVTEESKRKSPDEADSPRKQPKLLHDAFRYSPRPQSSAATAKTEQTRLAPQAMDLSVMTHEERERCYEDLFSKQNEPLRELEFPSLASEQPRFATKINAAYLRHTTFSVEVWMNYDTAAHRFFYDDRAQDCGRMRLPSKLINCLSKHEYGKIRFELRTPFTRLAAVVVAVEPTELDIGLRLKSVKRSIKNEDSLFAQGVSAAMNNIKVSFEPTGRKGMNFEDLAALAAEFRMTPGDGAYTWGGWLRNTDTWMNIQRPGEHNEGYVSDI